MLVWEARAPARRALEAGGGDAVALATASTRQ